MTTCAHRGPILRATNLAQRLLFLSYFPFTLHVIIVVVLPPWSFPFAPVSSSVLLTSLVPCVGGGCSVGQLTTLATISPAPPAARAPVPDRIHAVARRPAALPPSRSARSRPWSERRGGRQAAAGHGGKAQRAAGSGAESGARALALLCRATCPPSAQKHLLC